MRVRVRWRSARTGRCRSAGWAACTWLRLELGLGLGLGSGLGLDVDPLDGQLVPAKGAHEGGRRARLDELYHLRVRPEHLVGVRVRG